ncbi:unnamed protein product [Durusdinium trenchii]|uniref:Uncharacterized protein n=1 Tax=Durusdinium trenchii TaxID=1381693 RepID=A0ABP0RUW0_9DINO
MLEYRLYDLLEVNPKASQEEIKRAYRRLALKLHPDRGGDAKAFQELSNAYEVLSNPERRALYDRMGDEGMGEAVSPQPRSPTHDIFDILGDQGAGPFADLFGFGTNRPTQVEMSVTLEEAYLGTSRQIRARRSLVCRSCHGQGGSLLCLNCEGSGFSIHRRMGPSFLQQVRVPCRGCRGLGFIGQPCSQCRGSGLQQEQQVLSAMLPPGVHDGHLVACYTLDGRSCDDVMFLVRVQQHPRFKRSGDDLHIAVELGLADALLGKPVRLRHLDGRELKLRPKGLKPGIHVVQGEGMPKVDSNERGDLHLRLEVRAMSQEDCGEEPGCEVH